MQLLATQGIWSSAGRFRFYERCRHALLNKNFGDPTVERSSVTITVPERVSFALLPNGSIIAVRIIVVIGPDCREDERGANGGWHHRISPFD